MLTLDSFQKCLREITQAGRFCLAFSGGVDSAVLLHLLAELRNVEPDICLRAVHVNHGLSPHATQWEYYCEQTCSHYQVPITIERIALQKQSKVSLEEAARKGRYGVLLNVLEEDEILVTAHHQNDQAETLLLQLFRGAGPKGLASMPTVIPFGKGLLARPLLNFSRDTIEHYATLKKLAWLEDESNNNINFDRNFLRHQVLPMLQARWPKITENLARAAKHCANADYFIKTQVADLFNRIFDHEKQTLFIPSLLLYATETQNHIIRYWLQYINLPLPSTQKLALLQDEILLSRNDATPLLCWKQVEVRRYGDNLYAMTPLSAHDPSLVINWDLEKDLLLPNGLGTIKRNDLTKWGIYTDGIKEISIRFRQGGERCRLHNRSHSHSLKKLFQTWRVPPWVRDRVPLLYIQDELRAIVGYAICDQGPVMA